ncbi:MAG: hypothetical protein II356_02145, partial [Clostridia bacterium]|nr:hypothetical protein [Clostridia bacterium]
MKFKIQAYLRRVSALIMSFIMGLSIFGGNEAKPVERPEANSITAYNTDSADYRLTVDVEDEIHDIS